MTLPRSGSRVRVSFPAPRILMINQSLRRRFKTASRTAWGNGFRFPHYPRSPEHKAALRRNHRHCPQEPRSPAARHSLPCRNCRGYAQEAREGRLINPLCSRSRSARITAGPWTAGRALRAVEPPPCASPQISRWEPWQSMHRPRTGTFRSRLPRSSQARYSAPTGLYQDRLQSRGARRSSQVESKIQSSGIRRQHLGPSRQLASTARCGAA
jgi:hypothetical protein